VEIERQRIETAIRALDRRLKLLREEYADVASLFERGFAAKPRYMTLKRQVVELEGEHAEQTLRLAGLAERAARHVVRAPVSGVVIGLKLHTVGGVVKPGDTLLEIVPADAPMIVEARIKPAERDSVRLGQTVEVRLTSLNRKSTPTITGEVAHLSADALRDDKTGTSYFIARTVLDARSLAAAGVGALQPGMPVDIMINTGTQTPLGYLVKPLQDGLARTMRER
ncbi:MAG: HlyD family efflux transporter periplasmic adaptor subunit, partial [Hyphomicrobiaceae bacterium]